MAEPATAGQPQSNLRKQPNSRDCFVCGMENQYGLALAFYERGSGEVVCRVRLPDRYQGFPGLAHGGVLAAMLDEAAMRAAMAGDDQRFMLTARMTIHYRKPVPVGEPLELVGRLLKQSGRLSTARAQLLLPDGSVGAEAEVTLVDYPDRLDEADRLQAMGWKVYPD
ncbi:MAG TPA: PaaI family thioesterase [Anaerolineales bacterium]|jgi:acyl-coenzyme A thioesterase PaaI-like protein|nr:PaaI family thioesterase [Anaerolineales bacterium]